MDDRDAHDRRQMNIDQLLAKADYAAKVHRFIADVAAIRGLPVPDPEGSLRATDFPSQPRTTCRKPKGTHP